MAAKEIIELSCKYLWCGQERRAAEIGWNAAKLEELRKTARNTGSHEICPDCGGNGKHRWTVDCEPDFCYRCGGTGKLRAGAENVARNTGATNL